MSAMKKAKLAALKELMRKMHKMESEEYMDKPKGPSVDELADKAEDDVEDSDDLKVAEPMAMSEGKVPGSDDDDEDEAIPGMRKYMKRSSSTPIKGQTKSVMIAITAKPGRMGKKG